jgi:hypothetical protein
VIHRASARFWRNYRALPEEIRKLADRCFSLLKADVAHPSLHFKKVEGFQSVRVGLHYRALAIDADDGDIVWFWIGSHAEYDSLLGRSSTGRTARRTGPSHPRKVAPTRRRFRR